MIIVNVYSETESTREGHPEKQSGSFYQVPEAFPFPETDAAHPSVMNA